MKLNRKIDFIPCKLITDLPWSIASCKSLTSKLYSMGTPAQVVHTIQDGLRNERQIPNYVIDTFNETQ